MLKSYRFRAVQSGAAVMLTSLTLLVGCTRTDRTDSDLPNSPDLSVSPLAPTPAASPAKADAKPVPKAATAQPDPFQLAIERATSAHTISRSAQSRDDWRLVTQRWQQAIDLMKSVPSANPRHQQVAQKLSEYQKNLAYAKQQASRPTKTLNPDGVIVLPPQALPQIARPAPMPTPVPIAAAPQVAPVPVSPGGNGVFYAPIVRREGNTPVIRVLFNGGQSFDMIVDTGASGTLITRQMADALGVVPVGETKADTASQKGVTFPLGYVKSIEVSGAVASNVLVAIAGPELNIGLLGHDFFGHYDVTIRQNEVEFRERRS